MTTGGRHPARTGWQRSWVRALTTVLTLVMMAAIFCFSAEDGDRSNSTSGFVAEIVIPVVAPDYGKLSPRDRLDVYNQVQFVVRKCAHFTEYMILGFLIRCCLESWMGGRKKQGWFAWILGTAYAGTDEAHQLLVAGRGAQVLDVVIDSCGVWVGVSLANLLIRRRRT